MQTLVPFEPKLYGLHVDQFPCCLILTTQDFNEMQIEYENS
jgi:hypothetical protein